VSLTTRWIVCWSFVRIYHVASQYPLSVSAHFAIGEPYRFLAKNILQCIGVAC
jgi:hypothetical protein